MGPSLLIMLFIAWLTAVTFLRLYRIWLPYYLIATIGCAYWLILVARDTLQLEMLLAESVAWSTDQITDLFGISTRTFDSAPGVLMVLVVAQEIGWTVLQIGVESSGLLEISVLASLLLFYPGWRWRRRLGFILIGTAATWLANVLRMLVIVVMLSQLGKQALVLAHTYIGKSLFFLLMIAIYWYLITLPTIRDLQKKLVT